MWPCYHIDHYTTSTHPTTPIGFLCDHIVSTTTTHTSIHIATPDYTSCSHCSTTITTSIFPPAGICTSAFFCSCISSITTTCISIYSACYLNLMWLHYQYYYYFSHCYYSLEQKISLIVELFTCMVQVEGEMEGIRRGKWDSIAGSLVWSWTDPAIYHKWPFRTTTTQKWCRVYPFSNNSSISTCCVLFWKLLWKLIFKIYVCIV